MTRWAGLLICALAVGFVLGSQVTQRPSAEETAAAPHDAKVSESDLELYIEVYSAMQADHGVTIDEALAGHNMSLDDFRDLERRLQADQRMVDRVRLALLNQAKTRNTWSPPGSAAGPRTEAGTPQN
jgi:hypothetical protein